MKKNKFNFKIDWQSKIIDLLIVIVGITVAFKLNNWNESIKSEQNAIGYLQGFSDENLSNEIDLTDALAFSKSNAAKIDSLKQLLFSKKYDDPRIEIFIAGMMGLSNFDPSVTTMNNITASGEFELINDNELRNKIIAVYNYYQTVDLIEKYLIEYVNKYATPYFFDNIRFSNFTPINKSFVTDPRFENIVIGYEILLRQQIESYEECLNRIKKLKNALPVQPNP